jgi:hypothetical protein
LGFHREEYASRKKLTNENDRKPFLSLFPIALISVLAVGASAQQRDKKKGAPRNRPNIIFFINDDQVKEEAGPSGAKNLSYVRGGKWRQEQAIIWGSNDFAALTFCEVPIRFAR